MDTINNTCEYAYTVIKNGKPTGEIFCALHRRYSCDPDESCNECKEEIENAKNRNYRNRKRW